MVRNLFIDLDGVLADFDRAYSEAFGVVVNRQTRLDPPGFWKNIRRHGSFFRDLPPIPDALELWAGAKRLHPNPVILTGIPKSVSDAAHQKREWVDEHIEPGAPMICCESKDKCLHGKPGDVLVDDWDRYRPLWEEMGGIFVLHTSADDSLERVAQILMKAA